VNYFDGLFKFLVNCVLGFVVLPEEGSSLVPKGSVLF
jgi:hypothetical protein